MTVLSELNKIAYVGSSSQTLYPIPFEYVNNDNIKVSIYSDKNEFVEDWTYSTQYIIEDNNVKVLSGYEIDSSKKILILRDLEIVQDNKYREGGDFPAKSTELSFDKLTMIAQQHQEILDRCVKVEVLDNQTPDELLAEVYAKLDSATVVAEEAIKSAEQAQTAADNATAAVQSAENTLRDVTAYVDQAKIDIGNTKTAAETEINKTRDEAVQTVTDTKTSAETEINSVKDTAIASITAVQTEAENNIDAAVTQGKADINQYVADAESEVRQIAVDAATAAIANAAAEATQEAKDNVNQYVDGTVKPSLQTYVDQAEASKVAANTSEVNAKASESSASASASAAKTSETNAKASETSAAQSAQEAAASAASIDPDAINAKLATKQDISNLSQTIDASTDKYPSNKAVVDYSAKRHQVVSVLPVNPDANTFYYIPEE